MMFQRFRAFLERTACIHPGQSVLLAVSGGPDSIALMDLFCRLEKNWHLRLSAAHLNHGLRGREADFDEVLVRRAAARYGMPLYSAKADIRRYIRSHAVSLEMGARSCRMRCLKEIMMRIEYDVCAFAHHADDQAETMLMNMARGMGMRGLGGIRSVDEWRIHPLLFANRSEILSYCRSRNLAYAQDISNTDCRIQRNRVRAELIPVLERTFGKGTARNMARSAEVIQEAWNMIDSKAKKAFETTVRMKSTGEIVLDIQLFLKYFKAVRKAVLIHILEDFCHPGHRIRLFEIERILDLALKAKSGACVHLEDGIRVQKSRHHLAFFTELAARPEMRLHAGITNRCELYGMLFIISDTVRKHADPYAEEHNRHIEYLNGDILKFPLKLRNMQSGDYFHPLGMKGKKKLHDFFVDMKVPVYRRLHVPLIVSGDQIVWVVGYRIDERFKMKPDTRKITRIEAVPL